MVVAITTWRRNAPAAPNHTERGLPRVDSTNEANMVLSGSSPTKMIGKTAAMIAMCIRPFPPERRVRLRSGHDNTTA